MHASLNVGYQGKSGPGKIHEVILVIIIFDWLKRFHWNNWSWEHQQFKSQDYK